MSTHREFVVFEDPRSPEAAERLNRFLRSSVELMQVMARACGHDHLGGFEPDDLVAWKRDLADLSWVTYGGVSV